MLKKTSDNSGEELGKRFRHSLQPKSTKELPDTNFRHSQSHRYEKTDKRKDKKSITLTPIPDSVEVTIPTNNEIPPKISRSRTDSTQGVERKSSKASKSSRGSRKSELDKNVFAFQNQAFDDKFDKRSISSSKAGSSRAPSLQSLE